MSKPKKTVASEKPLDFKTQIADIRQRLNAHDAPLTNEEKLEIVKLKSVIERLELGIPKESLKAYVSGFTDGLDEFIKSRKK